MPPSFDVRKLALMVVRWLRTRGSIIVLGYDFMAEIWCFLIEMFVYLFETGGIFIAPGLWMQKMV